MRALVTAVAGALLLGGCSINFTGQAAGHGVSGTAKPPGQSAPRTSGTQATSGLVGGLLAYSGEQGVGVVDPATGRHLLLTPIAGRSEEPLAWRSGAASPPSLFFALSGSNDLTTRVFQADPFGPSVRADYSLVAGLNDIMGGDMGTAGDVQLTGSGYLTYLPFGGQDCSGLRLMAVSLRSASPRVKALGSYFLMGAAPDGRLVVLRYGCHPPYPWLWLDPATGQTTAFSLLPAPLTATAYDLTFDSSGGKAVFIEGHFHRPNQVGFLNLTAGKWHLSSPPASLAGSPTFLGLSPHGQRLAVVASDCPLGDWADNVPGDEGNCGGGHLYIWNPSAGIVKSLLRGQKVPAVSWAAPLPGRRFSSLKPLPTLPLVHLRLAVHGFKAAAVAGGSFQATATVTDGAGRPVSGAAVSFTTPEVGKLFGGPRVGPVYTGSSGPATETFTIASPGINIHAPGLNYGTRAVATRPGTRRQATALWLVGYAGP